jgi:hypothetical protein
MNNGYFTWKWVLYMNTNVLLWWQFDLFFLDWDTLWTLQQIKSKHILRSTPFHENRAVYEMMWKNIVETDRPQMTIPHMHFACWITKATETHSEYVILILGNNQLDAFFSCIYLFHVSTCFERYSVIIRRSNCINTSSGMISLCKWMLGMPVRHIKQSHRLIIPDDVLMQFDLLIMSAVKLETCRDMK